MREARDYYLDLMKKCLVNWIYKEHEMVAVSSKNPLKKIIVNLFKARGSQMMRPMSVDESNRTVGKDWPPYAHTMVGFKRLDNIQFCAEDIIKNNVPGDFIETGVWRGGSVIFMKAILKAYGINNRVVWVADSFEGLPSPDSKKYPEDAGSPLHTCEILSVSLDKVKHHFELYDLLDGQVRFLRGWFKDTLPKAPVEKLALMRLDGDMYESTMDALVSLYPKLSPGGYVIVDDYNCIPGCRKAVDDYRRSNSISAELIPIDWTGVYWKRE